MPKTITVSFEGDEIDRKALAVMALKKSTTVGAIIRDAVNDKYGDELEAERASFFVSSGSRNHQMVKAGK